MFRSPHQALLCALLATSPVSVLAATPAELKTAADLLSSEKPFEALDYLEDRHDPEAASTQEFFLLGLAAMSAQAFGDAERYFQTAVARAPSAGRIRLELAEVLYRQRKFAEARSQLRAVLELRPPPEVVATIDQFLVQIDEAERNPNAVSTSKQWSAFASFGVQYDSNVNGGPDTDTIFLFDLPFTLSPDAQETKDGAVFFRTGASHRFAVNESTNIDSSIQLSHTNYFEQDAFDTISIYASSGPSHQIDQATSVSAPIFFNGLRYNSGDDWYSAAIGISPSISHRLQDDLQVQLSGSLSRKYYNNDSPRNLTAWTVSPSLSWFPSQQSRFNIGANIGQEDSGLDIFSNTVMGGFASFQQVFGASGFRGGVTLSYTDTQFDGIQNGRSEARHDKSTYVGASVTYTLPDMPNVSFTGRASYQDNKSNIDLNDYDRVQLLLSVDVRF